MKKASYRQVFRLIFVLFFIYLLGDAFYRWDGFMYYATFSEFVPSVALITILWSILALFTSLLIWLLLRICEWFCLQRGWKVKMEHGLICIGEFVLLGSALWIAKRYMFPQVTSQLLNSIVFLGLTFTVFFLTWLFRDKSELWMGHIQERITPLFWLFVILTVLSVPVTVYHVWVKKMDDAISRETAQPDTAKKNRPNIILITFDALTARNMSLYGYTRETTPFISKWARKASVFTRVEAESVITTPTTASLMTGKRLWTHHTYHLNGSKPDKGDTENLPLLLKNYGYHTSAFVANSYASVKTLGIENSFHVAPLPTQFIGPVSLFGNFDKMLHKLFGNKIRLHDWILQSDFILYRLLMKISGDSSITDAPAENVFKRFLWFLNDDSPEPFFAWIHLYPPHDPYLPAEPFIGMFDPASELKTFEDQYNVKELALRYRDTFQDFPPEVQPIVHTLKNRYDEFIRYCDKQFEDFVTHLSAGNKLENTVIILSSDHGESFEHGSIQHSGIHLYEQVTHIPLIIKEPDQKNGRIINDLIEEIDIPATILDIAGIAVPSWMEGRSLMPLIQGKRLPSRPAFSMDLMSNPAHQQITKGTFAVWEDEYKLIHYLSENKSLLFNLKYDPDEMHNLFVTEPLIGGRMLGILKSNLEEANEKIRVIKEFSQEGS